MQSAMQPAAVAYMAGLRWCLEMYCYSSCPSFRLLIPTHGISSSAVTSLLSLGWAEHVRSVALAAPPGRAHDYQPAAAAAAAVLRAGARWRHSAVVDHTLTASASADCASSDGVEAGGPAEAATVRALHAYLNDVEFGGAGGDGPIVLPMLPDACATGAIASAGSPPKRRLSRSPASTRRRMAAGAAEQTAGVEDGPAPTTTLHPMLLYAPDYGRREMGEWLRVRAVGGAGEPEGCKAAGRWGEWHSEDEVGPPVAVPWAELPLLTVADAAVRSLLHACHAVLLQPGGPQTASRNGRDDFAASSIEQQNFQLTASSSAPCRHPAVFSMWALLCCGCTPCSRGCRASSWHGVPGVGFPALGCR